MWENILKADDDEYEYGRRYRKPDGSTFREGMGFKDEKLSRFKGSGTKDMPSTDLANWFATVNDNFEELFNQLSGGIEGTGMVSAGPQAGMPFKYKEDTGAFKQFKKSSMMFAKGLTEKMVEEFLDSIFNLGEDTGLSSEELSAIIDEGSVYNLMNSKAYQEVTQAGLKASTEIITSVLDQAFITIRSTLDRDSYKDEQLKDIDAEELMKPLSLVDSQTLWDSVFRKTKGDIDSLFENITTDMFSDSKIDLNLEEEGGQVEMSAVKDNITRVAKNYIKDSDDLKLLSGNALRHFDILYMLRLKNLEDSETTEGEEERQNLPNIDFKDEEYDDDFIEEFKSEDLSINNWQSILKVGGPSAVGMTSNAGFTPAVHNTTYGDCGCERKESKCGCDD